MAKKISNAVEFINSKRFKNATNNRNFTTHEIEEISKLYNYVLANHNISTCYKTITDIINHGVVDLIRRFKILIDSPYSRTKEKTIARYGKEKGEMKWEEYVDFQKTKNTFEYKKEKYGWSRNDFDLFNKTRAVTIENLITKHGEDKGKEIWDKYIQRQSYTNSLDYYKEKYGENGVVEWLLYNQHKKKSHSVKYVMMQHGISEKEAKNIILSYFPSGNHSMVEIDFVNKFENAIGYNLEYTAKTKQFCIWDHCTNFPRFYDIADTKLNKIIEFNGDYWHCNPSKFNPNFVIKQTGKTAKEVWERDYHKINAAIKRGFEVKIVWESDFKKYPTKVIEECMVWWNTTKQQ